MSGARSCARGSGLVRPGSRSARAVAAARPGASWRPPTTPSCGGQPRDHPRRAAPAGTRRSRRRPRPSAGRAACAAGSPRSVVRAGPGYHLATGAALRRRRLLLPDLRRPAARRAPPSSRRGTRAGAFKKFGYSVARQVVRRGRGARPTGSRIHSNYDICLVVSMTVAPALRGGVRPAARAVRVATRASRARTSCSARSARPRPSRTSAGATPSPTAGGSILYAPTFRGDRVDRGRATDGPRPAPAARRPRRRPRRPASGSHPFVRCARAHRPGAGRLRHRRRRTTRTSTSCCSSATCSSPTTRASSSSTRCWAGRWSSSPRTSPPTSASAASTSTTGRASRGRCSRRPTRWPPHLRAGSFDLERVRAFRAASFDVADGGRRPRFVDETCSRRSTERSSDRPLARAEVRYDTRPVHPGARRSTTPQDPSRHDLPSQTRRQALPPTLVGEPGPTQLLPQPRLRPRRRRRRR